MRKRFISRLAIEPRRTAEEFIDWLRIKPESSRSFTADDATTVYKPSIKRVDTPRVGPVVWVLIGVGVGFALASCLMLNTLPSLNQKQEALAQPVPAITETKTVTVEKQVQVKVSELSEPCRNALTAMQKYLDSAAKITSANNVQLDILSDAYQAIVMKDWKRLNAVEERQRNLERSLSDPTVMVMEPYKEVRSELDACLKLTGR